MSGITNINSNLKFITTYSEYIAEQELDEEGMPIPEPEENRYKFIFITKDQNGIKKYPDGSSSSIFKTYEIKEDALKKWLFENVNQIKGRSLNDNEANIKRKTLYDYVTGKKSTIEKEDIDLLRLFRTSVVTNMIAKEVDKTEVFFSDRKNVPTTDKIDVTFIQLDSK